MSEGENGIIEGLAFDAVRLLTNLGAGAIDIIGVVRDGSVEEVRRIVLKDYDDVPDFDATAHVEALRRRGLVDVALAERRVGPGREPLQEDEERIRLSLTPLGEAAATAYLDGP